MSNYYLSYDIDRMKKQREGAYLILNSFKKTMRLELKWVYTSLLNQLLDEAHFNEHGEAYLEENMDKMCSELAKLTNKKIDQEKFEGYMNELREADLIDIKENNYYLKRIV